MKGDFTFTHSFFLVSGRWSWEKLRAGHETYWRYKPGEGISCCRKKSTFPWKQKTYSLGRGEPNSGQSDSKKVISGKMLGIKTYPLLQQLGRAAKLSPTGRRWRHIMVRGKQDKPSPPLGEGLLIVLGLRDGIHTKWDFLLLQEGQETPDQDQLQLRGRGRLPQRGRAVILRENTSEGQPHSTSQRLSLD